MYLSTWFTSDVWTAVRVEARVPTDSDGFMSRTWSNSRGEVASSCHSPLLHCTLEMYPPMEWEFCSFSYWRSIWMLQTGIVRWLVPELLHLLLLLLHLQHIFLQGEGEQFLLLLLHLLQCDSSGSCFRHVVPLNINTRGAAHARRVPRRVSRPSKSGPREWLMVPQ